MYPWLWLWAPQFRFPFSGSVAQDYEPNTEWFFGAISPSAGDGKVERRAFEVASYGRQIGLLTEALLAQNQQGTVTPEQGAIALEDSRTSATKLRRSRPKRLKPWPSHSQTNLNGFVFSILKSFSGWPRYSRRLCGQSRA